MTAKRTSAQVPVGRTRRGAGARHQREPRSGLRHARPRARALRRAGGDRDRGRARRAGQRASARARCRPTRRTSSCTRSPHAFADAGVPLPGLRLDAINVIPHGRGLGSSGAAIVAGIMAAKGLLEGDRRARRRDAAAAGDRAGGAPGQRRARAVRRADHRLDHADRPPPQEAHRAPRRLAAGLRARGDDVHRARAQPAARVGAAPGRDLQRVAVGPAGRGAHPEPRAAVRRDRGQAAPGLPRERDAGDREAHRGRSREHGLPAVVSGAGPSILVLASDPSQRLTAAELVDSHGGRNGGPRSCWPSTSKVLQ